MPAAMSTHCICMTGISEHAAYESLAPILTNWRRPPQHTSLPAGKDFRERSPTGDISAGLGCACCLPFFTALASSSYRGAEFKNELTHLVVQFARLALVLLRGIPPDEAVRLRDGCRPFVLDMRRLQSRHMHLYRLHWRPATFES